MLPQTSFKLYGVIENKGYYFGTNNEDLAEAELSRRGYTHIQRASVIDGTEPDEALYFDQTGKLIPIEEAMAANNSKAGTYK